MLKRFILLIKYDYRVGGVKKAQNIDYVIYGWSLIRALFSMGAMGALAPVDFSSTYTRSVLWRGFVFRAVAAYY